MGLDLVTHRVFVVVAKYGPTPTDSTAANPRRRPPVIRGCFADPAIVRSVSAFAAGKRLGRQSPNPLWTPGTTRPAPYCMNARDLTALVHLVGFTTGIVLYAMLGVMTRRRLANVMAPRGSGDCRSRSDGGGALGVIWNVGAMAVFAARDFGLSYPLPGSRALAYTALGFLPAVVVQSTLRRSKRAENCDGSRHRVRRERRCRRDATSPTPLAATTPSSSGLLLLTVTYGVLLGVLAVTERRRPGFQRSITAVALAGFAVSALHLSRTRGRGRPGSVAGGAHRSSRVAAARVGHSLSGLSVCLCRSLPEARAVAACPRRSGVAAVCGVRGPAGRPARDCRLGERSTTGRISRSPARSSASGSPRRWRILSSSAERFDSWTESFCAARTIGSSGRSWVSGSLGARDADGVLDVTCALLARALGAKSARWQVSDRRNRRPSVDPTITLGGPGAEALIFDSDRAAAVLRDSSGRVERQGGRCCPTI